MATTTTTSTINNEATTTTAPPLFAHADQHAPEQDAQLPTRTFFKKKKYWEYLAKRQFGDTQVITTSSCNEADTAMEQDEEQQVKDDEDANVPSQDKVYELEQELIKVKSRLALWKLAYKSLLSERQPQRQTTFMVMAATTTRRKNKTNQQGEKKQQNYNEEEEDLIKVAMDLARLQEQAKAPTPIATTTTDATISRKRKRTKVKHEDFEEYTEGQYEYSDDENDEENRDSDDDENVDATENGDDGDTSGTYSAFIRTSPSKKLKRTPIVKVYCV